MYAYLPQNKQLKLGRMDYHIQCIIRSAVTSSAPKISMQKNEIRDTVKKQSSGPTSHDSDVIGLTCG